MKAADLDADKIVAIVAASDPWANRWEIGAALGNPPEKIVLAKLRKMVKSGVINGCACGCRGDFTVPDG